MERFQLPNLSGSKVELLFMTIYQPLSNSLGSEDPRELLQLRKCLTDNVCILPNIYELQ